jgi:hypothetical protein
LKDKSSASKERKEKGNMTKPLAAPAILRGLEQNNIAVFIFHAYGETLAGEPGDVPSS